MDFEGLTREQVRDLENCQSAEEALEYVKKHGLKLTDKQLKAISGGWGLDIQPEAPVYTCRYCGAEFDNELDCNEHMWTEHL